MARRRVTPKMSVHPLGEVLRWLFQTAGPRNDAGTVHEPCGIHASNAWSED
jgi:hypothetical protein